VSDCSAVRTSSSCTGVAVCWTGIVAPSASSGADGEPAVRSTKKLPSRKMRGRILAVASAWIGRPLSSIRIVTIAPSPPRFARSTLLTLPTSTPAIRTGDPGRMLFELANAARSS
jgi:hypothetical protein